MKQKVYINKNYIQERLDHICRQLNNEYPCLLLPELTPVEIDDVLDWFSENDIYEEAERRKIAESIFRDTKTNTLKTISMSEVEVEFQKIIDRINADVSVDNLKIKKILNVTF